MPMDFEKLKKEIEQAENKKSFLYAAYLFGRDTIRIRSSLYMDDIYCNNVESVSDIYNIVDRYQLDPLLFSNPFYIIVSFENYDENTIRIINQLDRNIHVQIAACNDIDKKAAEMLTKIEHPNCHFSFNGYIYQSAVEQLLSKMPLDAQSSPVIVIDEITPNTINIINNICSAVNEPRFRIEIKDKKSLQNLYSIIPHIPEEEVIVQIDDNLFSERNPNNARSLIISEQGKELSQTKKMNIYFNDISYESVEQIYELEKYLEIIKSHIPSNASDLDIVTYVSMFIVNYFKYDFDLYEKNTKDLDSKDINLTQFVTSGKGVCRHFASFTKYLLNSLGVECERVNADGDYYGNSSIEGHAFNVVKIDGKMYFLDNTWLAGRMQTGKIHSLAESTDYLASNTDFGHEDYKNELEDYECESYNREEINNAVIRVLNWNQNYKIHPTALRDLFRKHILKKEMSIDQKIENAIPRRH